MEPIYLDYNATTPVDPEVAETMLPFLTKNFGNPSSNHYYGGVTKQAIENARKQVASLINCQPHEIVFTSGGTESNNYAIKGSAFFLRDKGNHIITSCIEHPAVIEVCEYLEQNGYKVSYLPVNKVGQISINELEKEITTETILITIMHANNEIGTIQPIKEISEVAQKHGIRFHTDAAQSVGKVEIDVGNMGVDLLSIAGHKLYAPKGIGALYIKDGLILEKFMHGANHEQNKRAGTENVLEIVGLGKAAEVAKDNSFKNFEHSKKLRDLLYEKIKENLPSVHLNGHEKERLPNTLNISFPGIDANKLLAKMPGIAASAGAACHSDGINISQVLKAINLPPEIAMGTIRFTTGRFLTKDDIKLASSIIIQSVKELLNVK